MTKKELVTLLIEEFYSNHDDNTIDLTDLDFGKYYVDLSKLKAGRIYNKEQYSIESISNDRQESDGTIWNTNQKAPEIIKGTTKKPIYKIK